MHQKPQAAPAPSSGGTGGAKRPVKKVDPPRSIAGGTSPTAVTSVSLNTAAVAELGARTRADSLAPGLSPRVLTSPRKSMALTSSTNDAHSEPDHHGDANPPPTGGTGSAGGASTASSNAQPGSGASAQTGLDPDLVYGLAMFQNKSDKTVRRGAIQKSLLIISRAPIFDIYQPILRHALAHIMETGDKNALKTLFETLKSAWGSKEVNIFGHNFPIMPSQPLASMKPDEFGSASLKELVQRFGVDTMYLWYTMLLRQRVLFSGQPAHLVGECCLACPLLVAPLHGFARTISPYVSLTDISPLERQHYICGTTNSIMETHTHRYDMMASFSTGIVRKSNAKLSAMDKEFILNVISGMSAKGEKWVRDQFFNYTKNFLDSVATNTYKSAQHKALGEPFRLSELYETYITSLKNAVNNPTATSAPPAESLDSIVGTLLQASAGKLTLSDAKTKQLLWDLLQRLVDLNTIDELCEKNILAVIAPMLDSNSAQVRKYAVATLAQIAISIKGQISLIQHNLIPRVVLMLRDPMPNVASAAAYCLYKISSLFIGVTALVQHRVPKMLLNIICSSEDNLTLKISTAETLLQIHRLDPTLPIVGHDNIRMMIRSTSDATFRNVLLLLLDLWGEARLPIKTTEEIEFHLASLRAGGLDVRTGSTSMLLSSVAQDRNLLLQIVAAGGIQTIIKNLVQTPREEPLARLSMAILCLACDTSMGRSSLVGYGAITTVLAEFNVTDFALHLYYACRFCEVACQYPDTTEVFLEAKGLEQLITTILKYAEKPSLQTLTMPCLGALKYLALLNPVLLHRHPELVQSFTPISDLFQKMIRRSYENFLVTSPHQAASMRRGSISSPGSPGNSSVTGTAGLTIASAYGIVTSSAVSRSPQEKEFLQLLHAVVSLWKPDALNSDFNAVGSSGLGGSVGGGNGANSADPADLHTPTKSTSGYSSSRDSGSRNARDQLVVPIIDDELRSASEKLVNLLQQNTSSKQRSRRGTLGSPKTTLGLDSINEAESEESLSRRASKVFERGDDHDLIAAADSILADLELSTSSPALSRQPSRTLLTPPTSAKATMTYENSGSSSGSSLAPAIDAMDDGIDQMLADLASETMRNARSRSATETEIEEAALNAVREEDERLSSSGGVKDSELSTSGSQQGHGAPSSTAAGTASTSSAGHAQHLTLGGAVPAAATSTHSPSPRSSYGNSLGGPLPGASTSQSRRPRWVPELNVGDMWDDIADLTTSILAEVPSAPSTPSTQGSSAPGEQNVDGRGNTKSKSPKSLRRSSDSQPPESQILSLSARAQRRSSLNLSSSSALEFSERPPSGRSGGASSPSLGRSGLRAPGSPSGAGGTTSPTSAGSPRSGSSPIESHPLLANSPRKKSSPRLTLGDDSGSVSPKREKAHSRKTSGGGTFRSHSPTRSSKGDTGGSNEEHSGESNPPSISYLESPGRKKSRRSIQIIAPQSSLLDDTAQPAQLSSSHPAIGGDSGHSSYSSPREPSSPRDKKSKRSSSEYSHPGTSPEASVLTASSGSITGSKKENRKSKRLSNDLGLTVTVPPTTIGSSLSSPTNLQSPTSAPSSNPASPTSSPDPKKLRRKSSSRITKDKELKKDKEKEKEKTKEKEKEKEKPKK